MCIRDRLPMAETSLPGAHRRHVLIMGAGFFGVFMAFNTAQALQSTLGSIPGLGNACLCTLYTVFTLTCLAGPIVVRKWGPRISMVLGAVLHVPMVLSNLKPSWGLSIPMYLLVGIGAPLLWTGQAVYLSRCANLAAGEDMAKRKHENADIMDLVKGKQESYNGYFFTIFQANGCLGLAMASTIQLYTDSVNILFVVLSVICSVGAGIITFGLSDVGNVDLNSLVDQLRSQPDEAAGTKDKLEEEESFPRQLWETLRFGITTPRMYLYMPMMMYIGMSLGFFFSDFTRYVVDEAIGSTRAGFLVSFFYFSNMLATMLAGKGLLRRSTLILMAALAHLAFLLLMLFSRGTLIGTDGSVFADSSTTLPRWYKGSSGDWQHPGEEAPVTAWAVCFLCALLFACGDAVWESQMPAILGGYFPEGKRNSMQAANYAMWQSFGSAAMFGIDVLFPHLGRDDSMHVNNLFFVKVLLLLAFLVLAMAGIWYTHSFVPDGHLDTSNKGTRRPRCDSMTDPLHQDLTSECQWADHA
eukprot:TRINITY_DN3860_c0_g6_i1.p1 TRINITY_DN3860_c0_g6~~TRINITY_DN3860_c0_g6_i1.p1  ORF type:complete len:526 (-),score=146.03 TRINITY_DN3860_c0_g6_i1:119-1696(-)